MGLRFLHDGTAHGKGPQGFGRFLAVALLCVLVLEVGVFNLRHWTTLGLDEVDDVQVTYGPGLQQQEDGSYEVTNIGTATITLSGFTADVQNVYLDMDYVEGTSTAPLIMDVSVDDGSGDLTDAPIEVFPGVENSKYVTMSPYAGATQVTFDLSDDQDRGICLDMGQMRVNVTYPLDISWARIAAMLGIAALCWCLRPHSSLWSARVLEERRLRHVVEALCVGGAMVLVCALARPLPLSLDLYSRSAGNPAWTFDDNQYDYLARAFLDGRLDLDADVSEPEFLSSMANPFDQETRSDLASQTGEDLIPDYAWYDGHVYSYFGPLPALALFVPFKVLTGSDLPTRYAVLALALVFCVALMRLLLGLARTYFKELSAAALVAGFLALAGGSGLLFLAFTTTTYSVPILASLDLTMFALAAWLRAKRTPRPTGPSRGWLVTGSVLMAANLGCRYTFVLACLLALPIFWDEIAHDRSFFAATGLAVANTACVLLPFVVLAVPVLWYNAARFSSPLDFGSTYNLTNNDLTTRGTDLARLPFGFFSYLFQPISMDGVFPYVHPASNLADYVGYVPTETTYGGLLWLNPLLWALVACRGIRGRLKAAGCHGLVALMVVLGLAFVALDTEMGGIIQRYESDFAWLLLLASVLVAWALLAEAEARPGLPGGLLVALRTAVAAAALVGVALNLLVQFDPSLSQNLYWNQQYFYFTVRSWFV
ncbi:MAG: hypothetical protein PHR15_02385 [Atopobiaceae bacterium]|nr:hypothetical protein [Atopobiaceae bacterium]MCH4180513.1 hypothetical protein [Atopobiaceae bacterium]MCH4214207.1 hypothetical protein [Atopobiaceae bacterium]MCH4230534.1 hypothetical protein [Atopobiaceae bacterium]MCH4275873.1 hypothetical protein [Atopobiaceae bacterium]